MKLRIPGSCLLFLKLALWGGSLLLLVRTFGAMVGGTNQLLVVIEGLFLLGELYLFGMMSSWVLAGPLGDGLTDFLLYPRRYLKAPGVILSRQQGLIASGQYQQAECELLQLRAETPHSPEITRMLLELHGDIMLDGDAAFADCRYYFQYRRFRFHPFNVEICLRYADLLCLAGIPEEAVKLLRAESRRFFYSQPDRKSLKNRLSALLGSEESPEE